MSIFNDYGISGVGGEEDVVARTCMIVFKRIDVEKMRCVPFTFRRGSKAIKEYTVMYDESSNATREL
jgi:hypothetical protein